MKIRHLLLALLCSCLSARALDSVRVFYFGNSLTANTMPQWQGELGKSAGKEWIAQAWLGAGWQLWQHREAFRQGGAEFDPSSSDDLTIDESFIASREYNARVFLKNQWDAIVLQAFSPDLVKVSTQMWGKVSFDAPTDCGDLQSAADLAAFFLKINPQGTVYLYECWPSMRPGEPRDGMRGAEFPLRDEFDYEAQWMQPYARQSVSANRTLDFHVKLFRGLIEKHPELWEEGRLRMIPSGDVYLELDHAMQKGKVPGIGSINDFYTDVQHQRAGLPRYTDAAIFYACLFREHPGKLDWRIYNNAEKYGPDPYHDAGELLEITPERAAAVNNIIWETLTRHPYTGMNHEAQ